MNAKLIIKMKIFKLNQILSKKMMKKKILIIIYINKINFLSKINLLKKTNNLKILQIKFNKILKIYKKIMNN